MPARARTICTRSPTTTSTLLPGEYCDGNVGLITSTTSSNTYVVMGESVYQQPHNHNNHRSTRKMGEELPILKGILNGVVNYHNARMSQFQNIFYFFIFFCLKNLLSLSSAT